MHRRHGMVEGGRSGKRLAVASVLGSALIVPGFALAQNPQGWYAGMGVGESTMKDESTALLGTQFDDSDTGGKIFGGYSFTPNGAIEFGYVDFGEFTGSGGGFTDNWEASGLNLSLLGAWPLAHQFSLLGKIGVTRWDVDNTFTVGGAPFSPSENGTDVSYGVGAQYDFHRQVGARLEWERFADVGDSATTGQSDLDLLSLSVVFKFR